MRAQNRAKLRSRIMAFRAIERDLTIAIAIACFAGVIARAHFFFSIHRNRRLPRCALVTCVKRVYHLALAASLPKLIDSFRRGGFRKRRVGRCPESARKSPSLFVKSRR
jgi:hypothetical protein